MTPSAPSPDGTLPSPPPPALDTASSSPTPPAPLAPSSSASATPPPPPLQPVLSGNQTPKTQAEIDALTAFRLALHDPLSALARWDSSSSSTPCSWRGVLCSRSSCTPHIVELCLPASTFLVPSPTDLPFLQKLSLHQNSFSGPIPTALSPTPSLAAHPASPLGHALHATTLLPPLPVGNPPPHYTPNPLGSTASPLSRTLHLFLPTRHHGSSARPLNELSVVGIKEGDGDGVGVDLVGAGGNMRRKIEFSGNMEWTPVVLNDVDNTQSL
uniref:Proline-rich receptor-like protein kinase PERK2 n=1 Tax=Elaeis guineensis var. tenera TaxID=51953 RepID=A0A6I9QA65_ELAGV|nr:proline-rich receptor-like protein kinase PERK2 [Elaeis guineensis]